MRGSGLTHKSVAGVDSDGDTRPRTATRCNATRNRRRRRLPQFFFGQCRGRDERPASKNYVPSEPSAGHFSRSPRAGWPNRLHDHLALRISYISGRRNARISTAAVQRALVGARSKRLPLVEAMPYTRLRRPATATAPKASSPRADGSGTIVCSALIAAEGSNWVPPSMNGIQNPLGKSLLGA